MTRVVPVAASWLFQLGCVVDGGPPGSSSPGSAELQEGALDLQLSGDTPFGGGATALEECNGTDDDGDGEVDEGFADTDADGVADCVDRRCEVVETATGPGTSVPGCQTDATPALDPWDLELVWSGHPGETASFRADTVADLSAREGLEVAFLRSVGADQALDLVSPVTGDVVEVIREVNGPLPVEVVAAVEGETLLVSMGGGHGGLVARELSGALVWQTVEGGFGPVRDGVPMDESWGWYSLESAYLSPDGDALVGSHRGLVSLQDGALSLRLSQDSDLTLLHPTEVVVVDLDLDDEAEILFQQEIRDADGAVRWSRPLDLDSDLVVANPLVFQADADPEAEVAWLGSSELVLVDDDGTVIWEQVLPRSGSSSGRLAALGCAGDLDGDGLFELAYSDHRWLYGLDTDGSELWSEPIVDETGAVGCSVFDFDLDGALEVVHGAEQGFTIRDGATGAVLFEDPTWSSGTTADLPKVVDLDGDGSVEIILTGSGPVDGSEGPRIHVYSHAEAAWPPGFPGWYGSTWSGVSRRSDGRVVHTRDPSWLQEPGIWRGQPANPALGIDLRPEVVDACVSSLEREEAEVRLAVRLGNAGPEEAMEEARLGVYLLDAEGSASLHRLVELGEILNQETSADTGSADTGAAPLTVLHPYIDEGQATRTLELVFTLAEARHGVVLVAGDDGTGSGAVVELECHTDDNVLVWVPGEG